MSRRTTTSLTAALLLLASATAAAQESGQTVETGHCDEAYRQFAISPPLQKTSSGDEGFPWRGLYGYCVVQWGRLSLHQDWVVSYLDATPQGDAPGGTGVGLGTDFSLLWHLRRAGSIRPYVELAAGIQYAAGTSFPAHGSRWMIPSNVGVGALMPLNDTLQLNLGIRYMHISNAGLLQGNAGYDAIHLLVGVRW